MQNSIARSLRFDFHDTMSRDDRPYRKNVGIILFNRSGMVLVGERLEFPGVFQFPQGGIDDGEEPLRAARRELFEETGIEISDPPAYEIAEWLHYDFPEEIPERLKRFRGQAQKWFFFEWEGDPASLSLQHHHEQEFRSMKWAPFPTVVAGIVSFKKEVYARLYEEGRSRFPDLFS